MTQRALGKMLVGNIIVTAAARAPNKVAFYCAGTGRRFTFRQVNERCNRLANMLARLGLAKGDVVAFLCSNRAEMPEIYFALAKCGIVGIPLNYRLAPTEMAELMRAMGARVLRGLCVARPGAHVGPPLQCGHRCFGGSARLRV
jgi:fatty-acyl-CoA synthase